MPVAQPQQDDWTTRTRQCQIMRMSELLKEAKLTQYNLEFCGLGHLPIVLRTSGTAGYKRS